MSESGQGKDHKRAGKRGKGRSKHTALAIPPLSATTANSEPTAIEDLSSPVAVAPASPSFVVNMSSSNSLALSTPPAPTNNNNNSGRTLVSSPERIVGEGSIFSGSPSSLTRLSTAVTAAPHEHHYREPCIGERFGRRHGQDWPVIPHNLGASDRCASCPGSRSESRSKSRGGADMRRTSGILFKVIPAKPVMGPEVFQAARKTEKEISAIKGSKVREYYRSLNELLDSFSEVEEVLREHREDEQAQVKLWPQLPNGRTHDDQNTDGYGATNSYFASGSNTPNDLDEPSAVVIHDTAKNVSKAVYPEYDADDNVIDENAPLMEYKRRKRTSPRLIQLAINVSFLANVVLVFLKIWTVLLSDSLAVLASMIDSFMDLLSGAIIWYSARLRSNTTDGHRYPVGKARMEPLGIIVFAAVMVTSFMQVMMQAFERLVAGSDEPPVDLGVIILILLALNIAVKFALWLWCRTMKDSSSVLALAQDHLNDVVFNIFSTLFPVAGKFMGWWWLDAVGAIILSIYIITEWTGTCLHNIRRLTGHAATPQDIQQLTYMTYRFSNTIQEIDTVRAYYIGDGLFVEIDIVLPPDTPLSQAHDLGESLQGALERLDSVERAFVHIDYNAVHAIEHR